MCFLRLAFTPATVTGEAGALAEAAWQLERNGFMCWGKESLACLGKLLQKPFLLCGLCVLAEDFDLERKKGK